MATKNAASVNVGPLADRVVVRSLDRNEQTRGGLFIPDTAKEKTTGRRDPRRGPWPLR
jgi:hypothetical protein